jgi:tripartite-type tricarboxylate transporter receptor subunit TctC
MRRCFLLAGLLAVGCRAQDGYPNRPILLVVPWAPGGGTDRVARQVAALLEQDLKVNVNVQNATGGEGVTGHGTGAFAKPDGYTLTLMTVEINMLRWRGRTKLSYKDFTPVLLINRDPAALFVRADAPWESLPELQAEVARSPGGLRASGTAIGAIWHVALAGWLIAAGRQPSDIPWVASTGAGPALNNLPSRGVDLVCCSLPEGRTLLEAGLIRCLGVMAPERHPQFPGVPTFREQGVDWSMTGWRGVGVPRGTPPRVLDVLVPALERVVKSPRFLEYMKTEGFGPACEPPAQFEKSLEETDDRMKALLTSRDFATLSKGKFGPMAFPSLLGIALGAVLLAALLSGALKRAEGSASPDRAAWFRFGEAFVAAAAYALLSGTLGFLLTAGPIVFLLMWRLGTRPHVAAPLAAAIVLGFYGLFAGLFRVQLPAGLLGG